MPKTQVTQKAIEPGFVVVHYDITDHSKRDQLRLELFKNSFRMETESVYYGNYSAELERIAQELKVQAETQNLRVGAKKGKFEVYIVTPQYTEDQTNFYVQKYEKQFLQDFEDANKHLEDAELMLANELLYLDKEIEEKRPYTSAQIGQKIHSAEYFIRMLESSLARRQELEKDAAMQANFAKLALRIRQMISFATELTRANKKRKMKEGSVVKVKKKKVTGAESGEEAPASS